jgi:Co/Zn/Cd efflux system component
MAARWQQTSLELPGMDCPAEEQLVRMALDGVRAVGGLEVDLARRRLTVVHRGPVDAVLAAVAPLGLGARVTCSAPTESPAPGGPRPARPEGERRVLVIVLAINATMFVLEATAGLLAGSAALLADSLDMLADASVYAVALGAVGSTLAGQRRSARVSGLLQMALAIGVLAQVVHRAITGGEPTSAVMMLVGAAAMAANLTCVVLLSRYRGAGVHLRATWIFSTNDAVANAGVIGAGLLVGLTGSQAPDLIIGTAIALLVASGAVRILRMSARDAAG